jgi:hypothetical protein
MNVGVTAVVAAAMEAKERGATAMDAVAMEAAEREAAAANATTIVRPHIFL